MNKDFTKNLIKGKITEVIFEEMFRNSGEFTILPFGYEHTIPVLAQYQHQIQLPQIIDGIRHTPDFVLLSQNKSDVFLVEVKFRHELQLEKIITIAKNTLQQYHPAWLFIANPRGFYFDSCSNIVKNSGEIKKLQESWIPTSIQEDYLSLLNEFIK